MSEKLAFSCLAMLGSATLTIVMSSRSMNVATQTTISVHHLRSIRGAKPNDPTDLMLLGGHGGGTLANHMHKLAPSVLAVVAGLAGASTLTAAVLLGSPSPSRRPALAVLASAKSVTGADSAGYASAAARSWRPSPADWEKIKQAARLRRMALGPHRTAEYRSFSAYLGLTELVSLHPIRRGRCTNAVSYLYDNLLDLYHAFPGENWAPLRRAVAREPSLGVCGPRSRPRLTAQYVA